MKNQLAYISGYIDGDGCFFISHYSNRYRSKVIISSTETEVLNFFQKNFGGTIREVIRKKDSWKPQFHWYLGGVKFRKYIDDLKLIEKVEDAKIFKNFIESKKYEKDGLIANMKKCREKSKCITKEVVEEIKNIPITKKLSKIDFSYLAGFIDAECCLGISKYKTKNRPNFIYKIYLRCNNTNPTIFYWLKERIGGSVVHIKRKHLNKNHNDQICWTLSGRALFNILPCIHPFLITKKTVCEKLLDFYKTTLENGGDRQSEEFKQSYSDLLSLRESICNEVHILNSKGYKNV